MSDIKKVLITGSSGGIGSSISNKFKDENFTLILTSSSDEKMQKLKNLYGSDHYYYKLNLSDINETEEVINTITKEHKDINVLINNAGTNDDSLILRMNSSQWSKVIQTNLTSNFVIIKSVLSVMLANKKGNIVGISSVVASTGNPGQSNYVSSKAGMIGLYKSVAQEVAKRNINVNIVSPGFIVSPMTEKLSDIQKNAIMHNIPMKKFGKPEDVSSLVYFLCTEDSSYITGQNFHVNGGMLMV